MTAQMHEKLIIDGKMASMTSCPAIPEWESRISRPDQPIMNTACWRGYVGTWEIKEDKLYLIGLEGMYHLEGSEPLFAGWFSGMLRVPRGKMLQYIHMGFESIYESELWIEVQNGLIVHQVETKPGDKP